jgi:UDP-3-O-[3-hydroxymyristoyl] N-acetylglucosamine deacetylase
MTVRHAFDPGGHGTERRRRRQPAMNPTPARRMGSRPHDRPSRAAVPFRHDGPSLRNDLRQQTTLAGNAAVQGFGYWSGREVRVEFRPAAADAGIVFVRGDLPAAPRIPARVAHRIETPRRTTLAANGAAVEMIEHIMAALAGLSIDNCEVWVDGAEMPGCDGSSLAFVEALRTAGTIELNAPRPRLVVGELTRVGSEEAWIEARPASRPGLFLKYRIDYGRDSAIGRQTVELEVTPDTFAAELASARTFLLKEEADWLRAQGRGQRATYQDLLVFDRHGPIENELRFRDECVRHKALDLVGDLALAGCDLSGHFIAHRGGHRLNAELLRAVLTGGQIVGGWRRSA